MSTTPATPIETVSARLYAVALERGLRKTTLLGYKRLMQRMGLLDLPMTAVTRDLVTERLWTIDSPNTRRTATIVCRSVFGYQLKVPRGVPKRYDLPEEDMLRFIIMMSPHEPRYLLMMYAGLRLGEASAVTANDFQGDRLTVARQVIELRDKGKETVVQIGPVKTGEATVTVPTWVRGRCKDLEGTVVPSNLRQSLTRAGRKVGHHINPHMLRHWYCTALLTRGVPLPLVQQQMRHLNISTTLGVYAQMRDMTPIQEAFPR